MARPRRDAIACKDFHRALTVVIRRSGIHAKPVDITRWAYAERGGTRVSTESIRKAHVGVIDPTQCAVELLLVLRDFYEAGPGEMGDVAQTRIDSVMAFATAAADPAV